MKASTIKAGSNGEATITGFDSRIYRWVEGDGIWVSAENLKEDYATVLDKEGTRYMLNEDNGKIF